MEGAEGHFRPVVVAGPSGVGKSTNISACLLPFACLSVR